MQNTEYELTIAHVCIYPVIVTNLQLVPGLAEDRADVLLELLPRLLGQDQKQKQALDKWGRSAAAQARIANNGHERNVHMVAF